MAVFSVVRPIPAQAIPGIWKSLLPRFFCFGLLLLVSSGEYTTLEISEMEPSC